LTDPYAITNSRRFDVINPRSGGILFVAQDNGQILNPMNLATDRVISNILTAKYYREIREIIKERLRVRLDEIRKKNAMDKAIQRILAEDTEYQKFLTWSKDERKLGKLAEDHMNSLLHFFWELKDLASIGTPEPPTGKYDEEAFNLWMHHLKNQPTFKSTRDTRSAERKKLDNMFQEAQAKRAKRKNPSMLQRSELR
jgi:hypothetical protein